MNDPEIAELRLTKNGTQYAVSCVHSGAKYHYWSEDHAALTPVNDILYKSPLQGTSRMDANWFQPRKLKVSKNKTLVDVMRMYALRSDLLAQAVEADAEAEAGRLAAQRERSRDHMVQEIRSYATWDLQTPIDHVADAVVFIALEKLIKQLANPPAVYD